MTRVIVMERVSLDLRKVRQSIHQYLIFYSFFCLDTVFFESKKQNGVLVYLNEVEIAFRKCSILFSYDSSYSALYQLLALIDKIWICEMEPNVDPCELSESDERT